MDREAARALFTRARVAHLATADDHGHPHIVPVTFAVHDDLIVTAVDQKPKRTTDLRRLRNVRANPRVSLLVDHYCDDWSALWWVRADGDARIDPADARPELMAALREKYPQYAGCPPPGPLIVVSVRAWSGWAARPPGPAVGPG